VTLVDPDGTRHSLDVRAENSYLAAHLFVTHAKGHPQSGLPIPTLASVFEVVQDGRVFRVRGSDLERWILDRRAELNGPRGYLFSQRPTLT
jgi:hypothetical protein